MSRRHSLPAEVYALVEQSPATVLLECGKTNNTDREGEDCTRIFTAPVHVCVVNTSAEIPGLFGEIESAVAAGMTAAGFFSYECGNCFEPKAGLPASRPGPPLTTPLAWFGIYERSYRFDHATGTFLDGKPPGMADIHVSDNEPAIEAKLCLTEEQYAERIAAIHEWIRAGDVYQLNFTVPYSVRAHGSVAALVCAAARTAAGGVWGISSLAGRAANSLFFAGVVLPRR
jgi:para-aminobenzoate synthetase component 1